MTVQSKLESILQQAHDNFYKFCLLLNGDLYYKRRDILEPMCIALQEAFETTENHYTLTIEVPPRTGKTTTINYFIAWALGHNFDREIMRATYSQNLTIENNITVKNIIYSPLYRLIFPTLPDIKVNNRNSLVFTGHHRSSLVSTSVGGSTTGFGCQILISDDLYNGHLEALSERINHRVKTWYSSNYLSRLDGTRRLEILVGTRWSTTELVTDRINSGVNYRYIIPALQEVNNKYETFCEEVISTTELLKLKKYMPEILFNSMYQQNPSNNTTGLIDKDTFAVHPYTPESNIKYRVAVVDTKTTGDNYFAIGIYDVILSKNAIGESFADVVVADMYYTNAILTDSLELKMIEFLKVWYPNKVFIETNKDYSIFRNFKRELKDFGIRVYSYNTTKNKELKILNNAKYYRQFKLIPTDKRTPFYNNFLQDLYSYDITKKTNDDGIDNLAMAVDILLDLKIIE